MKSGRIVKSPKILFLFLFLQVVSICHAKPPQELKFEPLKFTPPEVERRVLSNGTTLFLLPDRELPLVYLTAYIRTGTMYDSPEKAGAASLCGSLLRGGGTKSRKVEAIDEELEFLGAQVETGMDIEMGSASFSVLKKDLDKGLEIFADVLMNPAFNAQKLEIEKAKIIEYIRRRNDEPYEIARREYRKLIYGEKHPLSRTLRMEIPVIKKISRKDLIEFHKKYYHPNNMMIAVSGDFDSKEMVQKLESVLGNWKAETVIFPSVITVDFSNALSSSTMPRIVGYAERPVNQASVIMGHLGIKRHNPDRFALEVMNEILGGGSLTSRLYKEVRSKQGLAYMVGSTFSEPWDYGTIASVCQTKNKSVGQAIKSILQEIENIREKEVSEEELKTAKDSIINSFLFRYASSNAIVAQKMSLEYFGYSSDYLETYTQKISSVNSKDIQHAAKKYILPDRFTFMVVGNQNDFDVSLSTFGEIKQIDLKIPE